MKVAINAVSTGANVMTGRVYGNAMINVTVANNKVGVLGPVLVKIGEYSVLAS